MQAGLLVIHNSVAPVHRAGHGRFLTLRVCEATVQVWGWVRDAIMAHKRVLLLGPTGVDKKTAIERLAKYAKAKFGHTIRYIDFEHEYLSAAITADSLKNLFTFLAQDRSRQANIWKSAWGKCVGAFDTEVTVLGLHATYISGILGLRCAVDIPAICKAFAPTLVITLIDDVQSMWHRTEVRAEGKEARGRPSLEQLLTARRAELLLGDMIASHCDAANVRHVLVASSNALAALANVVIFDAAVTYLSFPISAPRRMEQKGDRSFIELINKLHCLALEQMEKDRERAFITPLSIDELPMINKWKQNEDRPLNYLDTRDRWPQSDLWGNDDRAVLPPIGKEFPIPAEQIDVVSGNAETDVGWRDRRLVLQARTLAICCPKDPLAERITRGVKTEIDAAALVGIDSFYWQNPDWDKNKYLENIWGSPGSMGLGGTEALVQRVESLEALVQAKP
jgi:hypothetical protein